MTGSPGGDHRPQGQAGALRERQLVVRLKEYFDQERRQGPAVSTQDAEGRVVQALGLGKCTVQERRRTSHQTGQVALATHDSKGPPRIASNRRLRR